LDWPEEDPNPKSSPIAEPDDNDSEPKPNPEPEGPDVSPKREGPVGVAALLDEARWPPTGGFDAAVAALYGIESRSLFVAATIASRAESAEGRGITETRSLVMAGSLSRRA
jgi:hypothetical protein